MLNLQACSREWMALQHLRLLTRLLPTQLCTHLLGSISVFFCVPFLVGAVWGCDIHNCYCSPNTNWKKEIFFHLWSYLKTVVDFVNFSNWYMLFLQSWYTGSHRYVSCFEDPPRATDFQNALIHMLWLYSRGVEGEAFDKSITNIMYTHRDTWNKRNSSRANSCTGNYEDMHIKQG